MKTQQAWNVYRPKPNGSLALVDTVYFHADMSGREVRDSLVGHDGYPADIVVLWG